MQNPKDPEFLSDSDEWRSSRNRENILNSAFNALSDSSNLDGAPEDAIAKEFWKQGDEKAGIQALVAQGSEQGAHNALAAGSNPAESTSITLPPVVSEQRYEAMKLQIADQEECIEIYEGVLRAIAGIKKVETPADQSAEAFFFVASKMRKLAIAALQKTGEML